MYVYSIRYLVCNNPVVKISTIGKIINIMNTETCDQ